MEYTKIIHDFIDGNLDAGQEQELFYNLSSSDELRTELKQQIAIKEAIKGDSRAFTPPASSTIGLFSSLGFNPPSSNVETTPVPGNSGLMNFLSKYRQGLIGGVIATMVTASLLFFFSNPFGKEENPIHNDFATSVQPKGTVAGQSNVPKIESYSNNEQVKVRYITKVRYIDVPRYVDKTYAEATESKQDETASNQLDNITKSRPWGILKPMLTSGGQERIYPDLTSVPQTNLLPSLFIPGNPLGMSVEFRGSQNWNMPSETIYPQKLSKFDNLALAVYYDFTPDFSAGLEVRQETFFQKFQGIKDGERYQYQQQPNFTSYGLNLRYILPFDMWGIEPFGQISGGFTSAGYIARGMAGLKYSPYKDISFILGGEYSRLEYKHQGSPYNANKFGLIYGVMFNF